MLRRVLNGIAVAGLATALLAGTAAVQTASADFASDLSAAVASGNPNQFAPAVIALAKAKPSRPKRMVVSGWWDDNANEMLTIHPAIASAAMAKRRFSGALRL